MSVISPDNFIADKLIAAHDGDMALLYIWLMRNGGFDLEKAARDLCLTSRETESAYEKLQRLGILSEAPAVTPAVPAEPEDTIPEYTAKDIVQRSNADANFKAVLDEAQRVLGRALSTADMKTLFGIYDYLALPPEVIFLLLNHCAQVCTEKQGLGRKPSMRTIEKEAYVWVNREILTIEQAEEYIAVCAERRSAAANAAEVLNIKNRPLTATEAKYIASWLDMGFAVDAIALAYDRTVTNTGALKWNYMNKIMLSWHEKGIHTALEVSEKDSRSPAPVKGSAGSGDTDIEHLKAVLSKVKNQK